MLCGDPCLLGLGTTSSGNDKFTGPYGVCCGKEGSIYVADSCIHRVQVFRPADRMLLWGQQVLLGLETKSSLIRMEFVVA